MKFGPAVIGIVIAGALGYLLEPSLRSALIPSPKKLVENDGPKGDGEPPVTPPTPNPPTAPVVPATPLVPANPAVPAAPAWVATLTPEQLPEKVTLKTRAVLPIAGSKEPMILPSGVAVTPKRVEGNDLVITPFGGPIEGKVAVMSTDLVELLGNKPPAAAPVAAVDPPNPAMPEATPPAAPEPVAPPAAKELTPEEIVAVMQESVKSGEIKEFSFDQVLGWKAAEEKESGGETYQSGLASYKAETIFGVKNIQAQALIKDGKVAKWIWPKSGMEIK